MNKELWASFLLISILLFNSCGNKRTTDDKKVTNWDSQSITQKKESNSSADGHKDLYPPCHIMVGLPKKYYATYLWPNKKYYGHVVIAAEFNKYTLQFLRFNIEMAQLYLKKSNSPFKPDSMELVSLVSLIEKRIGHVQIVPYLRQDCTDMSTFYIPIEVK